MINGQRNSIRSSLARISTPLVFPVAGVIVIGWAFCRVLAGAAPLCSFFLLLVLTLFTYLNYRHAHDVLYPAFVMSAIWWFAIAAYVFCPLQLDPLSWATALVFAAGAASFSVGCLIGNTPIFGGAKRVSQVPGNPQVRALLVLYSALTVPWFLYDTARIAGTSFSLSSTFFIEARVAVVNSLRDDVVPYSNKLVSSAPLIAILTAFVLLMEEKRTWVKGVAIGVALLLALLTTGRVALLQLFAGGLALSLLRIPDRSLAAVSKKLIVSALIGLGLLVAVTFITKAETQTEDGRSAQIVTDMTFAYIAGPLAAFDYAVRHPGVFANEINNTFASTLGPISAISGAHFKVPPMVEPWVYVPVPLNVYTAYKPYYVDFGLLGCVVAFALFGYIHGALFRKALMGSPFARFLFAGLFFAIIFMPFTDSYSNVFRYVYLIGYGVFYFILLKQMPSLRLGVPIRLAGRK
jgi:oligosaccharide repeat unit polymerase